MRFHGGTEVITPDGVRLMALLVSRVQIETAIWSHHQPRCENRAAAELWPLGETRISGEKVFPGGASSPRIRGVRRLFLRALIFLLLVAAGYVLWPRFPSLTVFRPASLSSLECEAFENANGGRSLALVWTFYRIFQEEFHLPPIAAGEAAWNSSRALEAFLESADNADRERALPYLERVFEILRERCAARFDPAVVARLQLHRWMLAADGNRQNQLPAAIAEILAMLYGGSASDYSAKIGRAHV